MFKLLMRMVDNCLNIMKAYFLVIGVLLSLGAARTIEREISLDRMSGAVGEGTVFLGKFAVAAGEGRFDIKYK